MKAYCSFDCTLAAHVVTGTLRAEGAFAHFLLSLPHIKWPGRSEDLPEQRGLRSRSPGRGGGGGEMAKIVPPLTWGDLGSFSVSLINCSPTCESPD